MYVNAKFETINRPMSTSVYPLVFRRISKAEDVDRGDEMEMIAE